MQEIKVRIISDYDNQGVQNWLRQQSKNGDSCFCKDCYKVFFTTQDIPTDYTIMINKVNQDTAICSSKIWGLQQEPYISGNKEHIIPFKNEFAKRAQTYAQCSKVFAFVEELIEQGDKFIPSPPYVYWLFEGGARTMSFQEIQNLDLSHKNKEISCIANTDKKAFIGHIQRAEFVNFLKQTSLPIDYYGGENLIEIKHTCRIPSKNLTIIHTLC